MKNYFAAEINGKGFFKTYILFLIPIIILMALSTWAQESGSLWSTAASLVQSYISMLMGFAFLCYAVKFLFFKNEGFVFDATLGGFAPKALKWYALMIITLGIYSPWYIRNYINYVFDNLSYKNEKGEFLSSPGKLLKLMLLTLVLPIIVIMAIMVFFILRSSSYYYAPMGTTFITFILVIIIFLIMIPFIYFYIAWLINFRIASYKVHFDKTLAESAGFLIVQILFSIITLGIYYPAACVKIYRFVANACGISGERDAVVGSFGFDGKTGRGFGLIWGQGLLTLITIGIYGPWAMSKVTNWFVNSTFIEGDIEIGQTGQIDQ